MVDYGRNLIGNIKVKTRSSGGDFVDMGKTKSDIEKNAREMEKLVDEIKADPKHSSDSGKMINDLKEDIRKLKLIKYDSQGKPTEESLMALYGKDVKNTRNKSSVVTGNSSAYSALYNFSDNEIDKLRDEANKLEKSSYSEKDDTKSKKLLDESIKLKDKVNSLCAIKLAKFAIGMLEKAKDADELDEIHNDINDFLRSNSTSDFRREFAKVHDKFKSLKQKFKVGNSKFKDKDGTLFEILQYPNGAWYYEIFDGNGHRIGDVGPFRYEDDAVVALKRHNSTVRKIGNKRVWFSERDSLLGRKTKDFEMVEGKVIEERKTFDGGITYTVKSDNGAIYKVSSDKAKIISNKNVVTLKSIPKRIDLDKKSDLEKAIKDITDLSKDYEHGIKVNDDDKYMHDKFVGLLKEANDEVKELKKILAKLN